MLYEGLPSSILFSQQPCEVGYDENEGVSQGHPVSYTAVLELCSQNKTVKNYIALAVALVSELARIWQYAVSVQTIVNSIIIQARIQRSHAQTQSPCARMWNFTSKGRGVDQILHQQIPSWALVHINRSFEITPHDPRNKIFTVAGFGTS